MNPEAAYQAEAEWDAARRSRELAVAEMRSVLEALAVAERERDQARQALREIEWSGYAFIGMSRCPACGGESPNHEKGCFVAAALAGDDQ